MHCTTTIRSPGAIALGLFFTGVTGYVLFKDVIDGAPVSTQHVLSLAAIVAALASGHMALPELKAGRVVSAAFMAVLFVAATGYVVVSSGARNAETTAAKAAVIAQANADRAMLEHDRTKATDMLDEEMAAVKCLCDGASDGNRKCPKAGNGSLCRAARASVETYTNAVAGIDARLSKLPATQREDAGYAHAAEVIAAVPGVSASPAEIERRLKLLMPFVVVLISELGTLAFLHMGLGHRKVAAVSVKTAPASAPVVVTEATAPQQPQSAFGVPELAASPELPKPSPELPSPGPELPPKTRKKRRKPGPKIDAKVLAFSDSYLRKFGKPPTGSDIKAAFPELAKSTCYDYAARARASMPKLRVVAA
jgi:hypothetical protein